MFLLEKYKQKRLLDILEANLIFVGLVSMLNAFMYSICGIPSIVLKIIAWSFLRKEKFAVVSANDLYVWFSIFWVGGDAFEDVD
jgi:hypothetical protein